MLKSSQLNMPVLGGHLYLALHL